MSSRFNRFLRGWLGFLDSKVGGFTPALAEDAVRPVLDVRPFAYAQARQFELGNTAVLAAGTTGFVSMTVPKIVPEGELWFVDNCSCTSNTLASGDRCIMSPAANIIASVGGIRQTLVLGFPWLVATAAEDHFAAGVMQAPFVMLPGDELGIFVSQIAVATPTVQLRWTVMKVPI